MAIVSTGKGERDGVMIGADDVTIVVGMGLDRQ